MSLGPILFYCYRRRIENAVDLIIIPIVCVILYYYINKK